MANSYGELGRRSEVGKIPDPVRSPIAIRMQVIQEQIEILGKELSGFSERIAPLVRNRGTDGPVQLAKVPELPLGDSQMAQSLDVIITKLAGYTAAVQAMQEILEV
jgi:hypothetical protein